MEAYIVAGYRTAVGKAPRGGFRFTRADDLAADVIKHLVASVPTLNKEEIDDTDKVPGVTVNRYCASGLETIATAVAKIKSGMADCIIAGGVEVMSGCRSEAGKLCRIRKLQKKIRTDTDEGPRADSTLEVLSKLKPVFAADGCVTAGNSSQTSDGAAFVLVVFGEKDEGIKSATYRTFSELMPVCWSASPYYGDRSIAIPKALEQAGLNLQDIDLIELNEAFASQSLAIIRELGLDEEKVNVNGGAIALGHPLGCTGAKLTVQVLNELKRRNKKICRRFGLFHCAVALSAHTELYSTDSLLMKQEQKAKYIPKLASGEWKAHYWSDRA
ncbi:hypothetical protein FQR65_LT16058 [Abscondita terminalis]|nr:hypothetical protein FQR65_LT16058 [Abscondita terminalis]